MGDPEVPPTFGRYKQAVLIGSGGMGSVYRALDPSLGRTVAIKVLTNRQPKYVERFRREAQVLAKIAHPAIVQVYEIVGSDDADADPYIVMEFFEGRPLDAEVKHGPLDAGEVIRILRQAAEGLNKAHGHQVIHRDIKPANLIKSTSGEVKILDFGIAKALDADSNLTGNSVLGTPYYMSPEQAKGQPLDARTDIYSLGITAFHLLTGRRPFEAKSKVDVMMLQVKAPLPRIGDAVRCDPKLAALVEKMCAKDPAARFQSCQELIAALDALPKPVAAKRPPAPPPRKPSVSAPPQTRRQPPAPPRGRALHRGRSPGPASRSPSALAARSSSSPPAASGGRNAPLPSAPPAAEPASSTRRTARAAATSTARSVPTVRAKSGRMSTSMGRNGPRSFTIGRCRRTWSSSASTSPRV